MRLLRRGHNGEVSLTDDLHDEDVPPYAILSHTWGLQHEEVAFEDIEKGRGKSKPGYEKIRFCAEQARRDGLEHFWIDTCCIYKASQGELSEAITSMFRWYQKAQKCYVYLADVSSHKRDSDDCIQQFWVPSFRKCKWFTRGWTLQELLAPRFVEFYSRERELLGTRHDLSSMICEITDIPAAALQGNPLADFSIRERMLWMTKRSTTRPEDMAYCLQGIFAVFIVPMYGERDYALVRLKDEISKRHGVSLDSSEPALDGITSEVSDINIIQETARRKGLIDWLAPPDPYYNHNAAHKKCESETGTWLLHSDQYRDWKSSTHAILWLTGKAGCGKTVLCSTVVEDLLSISQSDTRLAFFYFSFSDTLKQSFSGLLTSLITQLMQSRLPLDKLLDLHKRMNPRKPASEALEDILSVCLKQSGQTILVMDALDEAPEGDADNGRPAVLEWLGRVMQYQVRVFVTSRESVDIRSSLGALGARCVQLRPDLATEDIRKYITTQLEKHPQLRRFDATTKEKIKEAFEQKADGMFRWASCQLESLKSLKSTKPRYVEKALHDLPRTLDATYERMLLQIDEIYWEEARAALHWLAFETRPLSLNELAEACLINYSGKELSVEVDNRGRADDILQILAGLVIVEDSKFEDENIKSDEYNYDRSCTNVHSALAEPRDLYPQEIDPDLRVRLAHFSVKEYLVSDRILNSKAAKFAAKQEDQHILAQKCLAYVLFYSQSSSKTMSRDDLDAFPLLEYAAQAWTLLISKTSQTQPAYEIQLLDSERRREDWLNVYRPDQVYQGPFYRSTDYSLNGSALYYASLIGLSHTCRVLLQAGTDVNQQGGLRDNALCAASWNGQREIVRLLLEAGADIDSRGEYMNLSALQAASLRGHQEVVKLLLEAGADVNALQAACAGDRQAIAVLLIEAGADVNAQGGQYANALEVASLEGHREMVQLLLDRGADVNVQGGLYGNALQAASWRGHQETVRLLLDRGSDVNAQGGLYGKALQAALWRYHEKTAELLLDRGADVNAQCKYGSALYAASRGGYQEMAKLLLDRGADVNAQCKYGNALYTASRGGHQELVKLLLDKGADVNIQRDKYDSAVLAASRGGHHEVVKLLLNASEEDHQESAKLLQSAHVKISQRRGSFGESL